MCRSIASTCGTRHRPCSKSRTDRGMPIDDSRLPLCSLSHALQGGPARWSGNAGLGWLLVLRYRFKSICYESRSGAITNLPPATTSKCRRRFGVSSTLRVGSGGRARVSQAQRWRSDPVEPAPDIADKEVALAESSVSAARIRRDHREFLNKGEARGWRGVSLV